MASDMRKGGISMKEQKNTGFALCDDGVYRWPYELDLYHNPVILFLVMKIIFWSFFGIWAFTILISANEVRFWWEGFWQDTKVFGILIAVILALTVISYFIYAAIMGGKYCVVFEMDEKGIRHTQMAKQVKKAEAMSFIVALAGLAAKNPTAMGAGLLSGSRTSTYTEYKRAKKMQVLRRRNTIKLNETFSKNQIYAEPEDFDFVLDYISQRLPAKVRQK